MSASYGRRAVQRAKQGRVDAPHPASMVGCVGGEEETQSETGPPRREKTYLFQVHGHCVRGAVTVTLNNEVVCGKQDRDEKQKSKKKREEWGMMMGLARGSRDRQTRITVHPPVRCPRPRSTYQWRLTGRTGCSPRTPLETRADSSRPWRGRGPRSGSFGGPRGSCAQSSAC